MGMKWDIRRREPVGSPRRKVFACREGDDPTFSADFNRSMSDQWGGSPTERQPVGRDTHWLKRVVEQLQSMAKLEENWDGYSAAAPKADILLAAIRFISHVAENCPVVEPSVAPTRSGGVLFVWKLNSDHLEVQFVSRDAASYVYLNATTAKVERGQLFDGRYEDESLFDLLRERFPS